MKKTARLLALFLTASLTACAQPGAGAPNPPAIAPSEDTIPETRSPAPIVTGISGPITTDPVTTADPNAPIETVTHHITPGVTVPPFTTAPVDPAEPLEAVPIFTVEPVTDRSTEVRFTMKNQTGRIVWTNVSLFPLRLEQIVAGEWGSTPVMQGLIRTLEIYGEYRTVHGELRDYRYDIIGHHGQFLAPGEYRIPFQYSITNRPDDKPFEWIDTAVIFTVTADPDAVPLSPVPDAPDAVTLDFAAAPADTPGMLLLRMTNTTDRRVIVSEFPKSISAYAYAPTTLERRERDSWRVVEPQAVGETTKVNIESKSSISCRAIDPGQSRLFAFSLDRYALSAGEYRVAVAYGFADPVNPAPTGSYSAADLTAAAWHFTVSE